MKSKFLAISKIISKPAAVVSAAAMFSGAALPKAEGAVLTSMSQYAASQALAANPMYRNSVAVQRTDAANGTTYASAVMIAPDLFITAGHVTPRNGSLTASLNEIVFGANYNTSTERYAVSGTERYPGYVFGNTSTIDLGVGWTTNFVNGFTPVTLATSVPEGITLTVAEYGNYGDINTGELPSLGDKLAGRAETFSPVGIGYPANLYFSTSFNGPASTDPLNVNLLGGASGSGWWTQGGLLGGISIASNENFLSGSSSVLRFSPDVTNYLQPLIDDSLARYNASIPEPSTAALVSLAAGFFAFSRRRKD